MRRANVILAATLAVGGLVLLGGCGSTVEEGTKIDLTGQVITKPKKPLKPPSDDDFRPSQRRARKAPAAKSDS